MRRVWSRIPSAEERPCRGSKQRGIGHGIPDQVGEAAGDLPIRKRDMTGRIRITGPHLYTEDKMALEDPGNRQDDRLIRRPEAPCIFEG